MTTVKNKKRGICQGDGVDNPNDVVLLFGETKRNNEHLTRTVYLIF